MIRPDPPCVQPSAVEVEETLVGGTANRGLVVRVGDTVRRPLRPSAPATHALLRHLEDVGFTGSPRFLGVDSQGREVLSYVEGHTLIPPYPRWGLADETLDSVAALLREFHDATETFPAERHQWSVTLPPAYRGGGVICHNDPNLDNVVFRDGRAVALIDFDWAAPGSRTWDVASAVRLWAPLRADQDITDSRRGRNLHRMRRFVDRYGLPSAERARVVDAITAAHDWCYEVIRRGADFGNVNFAEYWYGGAAARAARARRWYRQDHASLRAALD